jgi:hypothetical protein
LRGAAALAAKEIFRHWAIVRAGFLYGTVRKVQGRNGNEGK